MPSLNNRLLSSKNLEKNLVDYKIPRKAKSEA